MLSILAVVQLIRTDIRTRYIACESRLLAGASWWRQNKRAPTRRSLRGWKQAEKGLRSRSKQPAERGFPSTQKTIRLFIILNHI